MLPKTLYIMGYVCLQRSLYCEGILFGLPLPKHSVVAAFLPSVLFLPPSLKPLFGHFNLSPLKIRGCFATPRLISALDPSLLPFAAYHL